jgi:hypothetical protein
LADPENGRRTFGRGRDKGNRQPPRHQQGGREKGYSPTPFTHIIPHVQIMGLNGGKVKEKILLCGSPGFALDSFDKFAPNYYD